MSAYTSVSGDETHQSLRQYDLGEFISLQGIVQGIINSNYFLTTSSRRYVLTIFKTLKQEELSSFLRLNRHLSNNGVACPSPISRKDGKLDSSLSGRPTCLVICLKGSDTNWPTPAQHFHTGATLAKMRIAGQDFPWKMENPRYDIWWHDSYKRLLPVLGKEDADLLQTEISHLDNNLGNHLPSDIVHADLSRGNVLLDGENVIGLTGSYYTCNGNFMYDSTIAVNDWARSSNNKLDISLEGAFISGYESIRLLSIEEKIHLPVAQRAGCTRFWISRLIDFHFPQSGKVTFIKDPNVFRDLLLDSE